MKKIIYALITIIIFSTHSIAQQKDLWTTITISDGLANNFVMAIIESSDGALWFGTQGGVSRYQDGIFQTFTANDGLADNNAKAILESSSGDLWFGTEGGISHYRDEQWKSFTTADGLVNNDIKAILQSRDGALWFGTAGGISRYRDGQWKTITTADGLANNDVRAIQEISDGALWFGTAGGISCYRDGLWKTITTADGLTNNDVRAIEESFDGALWFGTARGVSRYQDGHWKTFTTSDGLIDDSVKTILESSDKALWFGTTEGISKYQDGNWDTLGVEHGLVRSTVETILESNDGALWFGTFGGGISRYEEGIWQNFTKSNLFLNSDTISAITESSDGTLWFGTARGISQYKDRKWKTITTADGLANNTVLTILESSDGTLWFGTAAGLSRYKNKKWETFTTADGLASNIVSAIRESQDEKMWIGTLGGGVSCYLKVSESWTAFNTSNGLASNFVFAIEESMDKALWFGTLGGGVSRYLNGEWTTFNTINSGLADKDVRAILESRDGTLWFGTLGSGVSCYDGNWKTFTTADGLADNDVWSILESRDGALWFGTMGGGVSRYQDGIWITFSRTDGLTNDNVVPILESSDGNFWFGTFGGGVSRFKPDKSPPSTFIIEGPSDTVGTSTHLFRFSGRDFRTRKDQFYYSYAIVDTTITPDNSHCYPFTNFTAVQTPSLQNGTYRFYVKARDAWGNIDYTPATWTFTVDINQPTVTINSPTSEEIIADSIAIIGSAFDTSPLQDFKKYQLRYAFGTDREKFTEADWKSDRFSNIQRKEIRNDTLAIWNTEGLQNGFFWIQLSAWDNLDHESHDYVNVQVVKASVFLDARQGGDLGTESNQIEIYIPPNAISKNDRISVKDFPLQEIIPIDNQQITFANLCFEIIPDDIQLLKPATMSLIYPDSLINGITEEKLAIYHSSNGKENWQRLGGTVNVEQNKITTTFKQLGVFALYEDLIEGGKAEILNVNSQPRIFSPQGNGYDDKTAISFDLGKESNVTIKIYNPAGRLVKVLTENEQMSHGNNVVYWDGKDQQGEFCVSGLYIVTIQAEEKMATKTVVVLNK